MSSSTGTNEALPPQSQNGGNDHGHRHLGLALIVIATAQLMVILDATIVNIALPSIQVALNFSSTNLAWVINGYTLAFGGLLLLGGRAGDLFGRRRVFVFGRAAMFAMFYLLSLYVQLILGYSPIAAGVAFLPFTVGIVLGAGVASQLAPRLPPRIIAGVGLILTTIAMFLFAQLEPDSAYVSKLLVPMVIMAVGMGLAFVPFTLAAVSGVSHNDAGIASAILNTMQQVGGSLGLAILATLSASAANARPQDADAAFFQAAANNDLPLLQRAADALTHGYTTAFLVGAFMMLAALVITVVVVNAPKQQPQEDQAVHVG